MQRKPQSHIIDAPDILDPQRFLAGMDVEKMIIHKVGYGLVLFDLGLFACVPTTRRDHQMQDLAWAAQ